MGGGLRWPDSFVVRMERVRVAAPLTGRVGCKVWSVSNPRGSEPLKVPLIFLPFLSYSFGKILLTRFFFLSIDCSSIFSPLIYGKIGYVSILSDSKEWIYTGAGILMYLLLPFLCFVCSVRTT
jgi:hypothetical protein